MSQEPIAPRPEDSHAGRDSGASDASASGSASSTAGSSNHATAAQRRRWRRYLADEISESTVYRYLAERTDGRESEILREMADAEKRHEQHWRNLLGPQADPEPRPSLSSL
ncbi:MAG: rubrerythrin family protein, partial [Kocuria sp.]|nr:rubrerythrin family protein [Kocuria sp.]